MKKNTLITIMMFIAFAMTTNAQTTTVPDPVTINGTQRYKEVPISIASNYSYSQSIYLSSEIGNASADVYVKSLTFTLDGEPNYSGGWPPGPIEDLSNSDNWLVNLGSTAQSEYTSTTPITGLTKKFDGQVTIKKQMDSSGRWAEKVFITVTFEKAFTVKKGENLVVEIFEKKAGSNRAKSGESTAFPVKRLKGYTYRTLYKSGTKDLTANLGTPKLTDRLPAVKITFDKKPKEDNTTNTGNQGGGTTTPAVETKDIHFCEGDDVILDGTDATTTGVTYEWKLDGDDTVKGTGATLDLSAETNLNNKVYVLKVSNGNCTNVTKAKIIIDPKPTADNITITAPDPVCERGRPTFAVSGGIEGDIIYYTEKDSQGETNLLDGKFGKNGTATIHLQYDITESTTITLKSIKRGDCEVPITGKSATAIVNKMPEVKTIAVKDGEKETLCGQGSTVMVVTGTKGATLKYTKTVDGTEGAEETATIDATSGIAEIALSNITKTTTINLKSIVSGACTNTNVVTFTKTITVNSAPTASIEATNTPFCGAGDVPFTITSEAEATVEYTIDGGTAQTVTIDAGKMTKEIKVPTDNTDKEITVKITKVTSKGGCEFMPTTDISAKATVTPGPKAVIKKKAKN
ncbi:MAG: hypothetical protein KGV44_03050 [Flavobacteriaceae bacterium]|nr:hypothetical protein [Flavobacteriaceae bacterium]